MDQVLSKIPPRTDTFVFHLNCTITTRFPLERKALVDALVSRGIAPRNDHVTDISKRAIQRCCQEENLRVTLAERNGDPDERLIVKTNLNFAGSSEWALSKSDREALGISSPSNLISKPYDYFVVARKEVREDWWEDESLVCERYISNAQGRWYRAYIQGPRVVLCRLSSKMKVKKVGESRLEDTWFLDYTDGSNGAREDAAISVVHALSTFVRAFRLDFGTVDFVLDEALRPFIIDVNTTPAYNHPIDGLVEHLSF